MWNERSETMYGLQQWCLNVDYRVPLPAGVRAASSYAGTDCSFDPD